MADTEMQGGATDRSNLPYCDRCDRIGCRCEELAAEATARAVAAWLPGQHGLIAKTLMLSPTGAEREHNSFVATNLVGALLAAASTRPPAEEREDELQAIADEIQRRHDSVRSGGGSAQFLQGMQYARALIRKDILRRGYVLRVDAPEAAPEVTHYPGDGRAQPGDRVRIESHDEVGVTGVIEGEFVGRDGPYGTAGLGGLHIRVADVWECGDDTEGCPTCTHGCPVDGSCPPCDRTAERFEQRRREDALRDLVELLDDLLPDLAGHLPPLHVEAARERLEHARQWLPKPTTSDLTRQSQELGTYDLTEEEHR